jgi:hypothetical protein
MYRSQELLHEAIEQPTLYVLRPWYCQACRCSQWRERDESMEVELKAYRDSTVSYR